MLVQHLKERTPKLSIILLDWSVRESFHSLDYLNKQTAKRDDYELIWIEFYDHVNKKLLEKVQEGERENIAFLDQWILMQVGEQDYVHKHVAYNVGIALSRGHLCCICDSDAMYPSNFVERVLHEFQRNDHIVVHVDQIRNVNRRFYPFNYPDWDKLIADALSINWRSGVTAGLISDDMLHEANYGACMAATRADLIAIGGADEHADYMGYICGPYEMTFRLTNHGLREVWLRDIFTAHTWHPNEGGTNNLAGPHDGRGLSLRALEARVSGRQEALKRNPTIAALASRPAMRWEEVLNTLKESVSLNLAAAKDNFVPFSPATLVQQDVFAHNIVLYEGTYYALPQSEGAFLPEKVRNGEYALLLRHHDPEQLVSFLQKTAVSPRSPPQLARKNVCGCNIVLYEGIYYGLPQSAGTFMPEKVRSGEYSLFSKHHELEKLIEMLTRSQLRNFVIDLIVRARKTRIGLIVIENVKTSRMLAQPIAAFRRYLGSAAQADDTALAHTRKQRASYVQAASFTQTSTDARCVAPRNRPSFQPEARIPEHRFAKVAGIRKKFSVILNYFQKQETILDCIAALRSQTWKRCSPDDIEIILVDDGSSNEQLLEMLPEEVLYVWQRKIRYGICRAKNTGARLSNGDYLVFLDPDIIVTSQYFDTILEQFELYGDRIVQCGYIWDYHFQGCPDPRTEFGVWERPNRPSRRFYQLAGGNMVIPRARFFDTPGFDEDLIYGGVEDLLFGYHLSKLEDISILFNRKMEVRHIPHPPSSAHADPGKSWEIVRVKWPEFYRDYIDRGIR